MNNLCFVTLGSSRVYQVLIDAIQSVKQFALYQNTPFYVVGLLADPFSQSQQNALYNTYGITKIIYADLDNFYPDHQITTKSLYAQATHLNPFLNHIIDASTIFFIDADVWIQDQSSIDMLLNALNTQDIALHWSNLGLHAYKTQSSFIQEWQRRTVDFVLGDANDCRAAHISDLLSKPAHDQFAPSEFLLVKLYRQYRYRYINQVNRNEFGNFGFFHYMFPLWSKQYNCAIHPVSKKKITSFHRTFFPKLPGALKNTLKQIPICLDTNMNSIKTHQNNCRRWIEYGQIEAYYDIPLTIAFQ